MRHVYATCAGIGVALVFLGTVGLLGKGASSIGTAREVKEVLYNRCMAMVDYIDVYGDAKSAVIDVACPCRRGYTADIPLRYSLFNTDAVEEGDPWYPWELAIAAYKLGALFLVAGLPAMLYSEPANCTGERKKKEEKESMVC